MEPRITPDIVVQDYQETGMKPYACTFGLVEDGRVVVGCGAGAHGLRLGLWAAHDADLRAPKNRLTFGYSATFHRLAEIYGHRYVEGFMHGFDHAFGGRCDRSAEPSDWKDRLQVGYYDGVRAGLAVKEGIPQLEIPDYPPVDTSVEKVTA